MVSLVKDYDLRCQTPYWACPRSATRMIVYTERHSHESGAEWTNEYFEFLCRDCANGAEVGFVKRISREPYMTEIYITEIQDQTVIAAA